MNADSFAMEALERAFYGFYQICRAVISVGLFFVIFVATSDTLSPLLATPHDAKTGDIIGVVWVMGWAGGSFALAIAAFRSLRFEWVTRLGRKLYVGDPLDRISWANTPMRVKAVIFGCAAAVAGILYLPVPFAPTAYLTIVPLFAIAETYVRRKIAEVQRSKPLPDRR